MVRKVLILAALLLAGCQTPSGNFCDVAEPIRPSQATLAAMTDAEVEEALRHNELGAELCGWAP